MKPANRNLYNADCNTWVYQYNPASAFHRPPGVPLTAQEIHRFVGVLAHNGVDTLVMNPNAQHAWYPSKRVPHILQGYKRGDRSFFYGHLLGQPMTAEQLEKWFTDTVYFMDSYLDLAEQGVDWLEETAHACREHSIAPWISIRMNDMHGAVTYIPGSYMNCELFKDPRMRLRGTPPNPQGPVQHAYMGLNFERPEVRDFMFSLIEDAMLHYDYEGLELDWTRWALCCEPDPAQETIDAITEWHAEIRRLTEKVAARQGKPCPLGFRYFGTFDQLRSIGLDLPAMLRAGILDFLVPTNAWQSSWDIPLDDIRAVAGEDVAIYGCVECAPNWLHGWIPDQPKGNLGSDLAIDYRLAPFSLPMLRGNAAAKLALGADGIETFNFFCADTVSHWPFGDELCAADYSGLRDLEHAASLRGLPKFYTWASRNGYFNHEWETTGPFPGVLAPGQRMHCRVPMLSEPADSGLKLRVQVVAERGDKLPPLGISLNGCWPVFTAEETDRLIIPCGSLTHHLPHHVGLNYSLPLALLRDGWNEFSIVHGTAKDWSQPQRDEEVRLQSLEISVE